MAAKLLCDDVDFHHHGARSRTIRATAITTITSERREALMREQPLALNTAFMASVCSIPWSEVEVGGIEHFRDGFLQANHVYVMCETPFVIAASAIESAERDEVFGLCVIRDLEEIREFVEGPYPPNNRPETQSLEKTIGRDAVHFLNSEKQFTVLRKTLKLVANNVTTLTPLEYGLVLGDGEIRICIYADDANPMGLRITQDEALIEQ